jgi:hypothetical protein
MDTAQIAIWKIDEYCNNKDINVYLKEFVISMGPLFAVYEQSIPSLPNIKFIAPITY